MDWATFASTAGTLVGIPMLRSVSGWAVKALEDNKIERFEVKQLVSTMIRVGLISVAGYLSLNELGMDVSALAASFGAIIADMLFSAMKKK